MIRYVIDSFFAEQSYNSNKKINKRFINNKKYQYMKKNILLILFIIFGIIAVNAQVNSERGFILKSHYDITYTTPLVRSVSLTTIVSYYEDTTHGAFVVIDNGYQLADTMELPQHHYVYDFEVLGNTVYFCGKMIDGSNVNMPTESALVGKFDISPFLNNGGNASTTIYYITFSVENRNHNMLKKMVVYKDEQNKIRIMAIGESFLCTQQSIPCVNGLDFFAMIDVTGTNTFPLYKNVFTNEVYHDIIETGNHIVLTGAMMYNNTANTICFRKLRKSNVLSNERDYLYYGISPYIEPSTFVYAEHLEGDHFITSTFGYVNGVESTILRTFSANNMEMMNAQFIPFPDEKTQPYELRYIPATNKVLLLQLSTDNPTTRLYTIDPYPTQNYSTIYEYSLNWIFHSIDIYRSDEYILAGYSGINPAFYARNVFYTTPDCMRTNYVNVNMANMFQISESHVPMDMPFFYQDAIQLITTSSQRNLSLECY